MCHNENCTIGTMKINARDFCEKVFGKDYVFMDSQDNTICVDTGWFTHTELESKIESAIRELLGQ